MSQFQLLRERRFGPLFWTQFLGALNDNLFKTAFIFIITYGALAEAHDPALWTPMLNGLLILPFFLFSGTAGQIADKLEKARLIRWIKLWEVAAMAVAAVGFLTANAWLLAVTLFLMGTQSAFFGPVKYAILPQALGNDTLVSGNALMGTATFLAILIGSMGGGLVMKTGLASAVTAALVVAVAVAGWLTSRLVPDAPASEPGLRFDWNPLAQALRACRYASADPTVWRAVLGTSWFWFFGATLLTLFPTYGKFVLRVDEQVVTFFLMLFCVGIGLGAMACGRVARHRVEIGLVPAGAAGLSLFAIDLSFASLSYDPTATLAGLGAFLSQPGSFRIVLDLLGLAICGGLYIVPLNVLIQERAEPAKRSRILSATGILSALFMVVSAGMTVVYAWAGIASVYTYLVIGVMNLAVVVYIVLQVPDLFLRFLVWALVRVFYRLRISGLEHVPDNGGVVLAANHVTYVDALILAAALARPIRFVMHYKFADLPFAGWLSRRARVIPIAGRREDPQLLERALDEIADALESGDAVCIFPEGSLTDDGNMREFKKGIEWIVERTPTPVVPMGLHGLWGSLFSRTKRRFRVWTKVAVTVGAPIPVADVSTTLVRQRVAGLV